MNVFEQGITDTYNRMAKGSLYHFFIAANQANTIRVSQGSMVVVIDAIKDGVIINRCHCRDVVNASEREKSPLTEKGRTKIRKALNSNKELSRKAMDEM